MRGSEFLRLVEKVGRTRGVVVNFIPRRGKGSHGTLYFGEKFTIVCNLKRELKKGTFHGMLKQLGLIADELNG